MSLSTLPKVRSLCRYPVKALNAEFLTETKLSQNQGIPYDRYFALALDETLFNENNPQHLDKKHFLMLMKHAELAELDCEFNEQTRVLRLSKNKQLLLQANVDKLIERELINQFFADFMSHSIKSTPKLVFSAGHMFSDIHSNNLSLINLNSVRDFEQRTGLVIDPMRFRANVYIDGLPAWQEFNLIGHDFAIGDVTFNATKKTVRCAATMVDPKTAQRDINVPLQLRKTYGHIHMGIYIDVVNNGTISVDDSVVIK